MIHKPDIYFDFFKPEMLKVSSFQPLTKQMHHGDVYVYLNQIILHENNRWFKVNIQDILEIKTITNNNQILIRFGYFDLIIYCEDITPLLSIRDLLNLSAKYFREENPKIPKSKPTIYNSFQRKRLDLKNKNG